MINQGMLLDDLENSVGLSKFSPLHPAVGRLPTCAIVSTYPPTQCGLATFAAALANGLTQVGVSDVGIVKIGEPVEVSKTGTVVGFLPPGNLRERVNTARAINGYDFLLLQHEFGIFGGEDGVEVLDLLADVHVPVVITLHTVPLSPSVGQRRVLEALANRADLLVTMTEVARERLLRLYRVHPDFVVTIPHGATVPRAFSIPPSGMTNLLTWGLLGPGKGIEWVIDALALLPDLHDQVQYTIAGQTHPKVFEQFGESYLNMLKERAQKLGVDSMVSFDTQYRDLESLLGVIEKSTCVVLPYDSPDQITSGVLVDAVSAGRPVIATEFPHAVELLKTGAGFVVPHQSSTSIADAVREVATNHAKVTTMCEASRPLAHEHKWSVVAARYAELGAQLVAESQLVF
jgi:polysaccharide biosynthesis protein PslF